MLAHPADFYLALLLKIAPWFNTPLYTVKLRNGLRIRIESFWSLFLFDEVMVERCYEPPDLKGFYFQSIIDVGANRGFFTIRAKQMWPDAEIIAIEPDPENFASLTEHIKLNNLSRVKAMQIGLSDSCGCFDLYLAPRNFAGHSQYKKTDRSIKITTDTLENVISQLETGRCDLLKIDCEGCEFAILNALTHEIATRIKCILFEPERGLYELDTLLKHLSNLGFILKDFGGLILATRFS